MSTLLIAWLVACGSPKPESEAPREPTEAPAPAPEPAAEPEVEANVVTLTFGKQCEEPAAGEPADLDAVKSRLAERGIVFASVEVGTVCEACGTCPRLAVVVTTSASEADLRAAFVDAPADGKVVLDVGRKCDKPLPDAPITADAVITQLKEAGLDVRSHEQRVACQACGCPEVSVAVELAPEDAAKALGMAAAWTPAKKDGAALPTKGKAKASLP